MDYSRTLRYLDEIQGRGIKLGLENVSRLLAGMGDPQRAFPAVVVAGTNGKGSVSAMLASILSSAGIRTGLYTSPHLVRYEERIIVDGRPVTPGEFADAVTAVREAIDRMLPAGELKSHPTHFEVLTAAAFHRFRQAGIDAGVLEVGMGGRLDAVATAQTAVAVITNISLEHTKHLGNSVEAIAREKAGIIREGCWVVTGESDPGALAVIREEARGRGVRLIERFVDAQVSHSPVTSAGRFGLTTRTRPYGELLTPLPGRHQVENAVLAVLAAEAFAESGAAAKPIPPAAVTEGLARARWPGRLQIAGQEPLLILDGAHNPAGCEALARALKDLRDAGVCDRIGFVFGALQDKELDAMLGALVPRADMMVVTKGRSGRFLDPGETARAAVALGASPVVARDPASALALAREWARPADAIVVCGSLYLVGDAMEALGLQPYPDRS